MIVHFLRHGDRLTERGRAQAAEASRNLGGLGIDALWSSPLRRAQETAAPVAAELGLEIETHDDLRELREADGHGELPAEEQRLRRWSSWMSEHPDDPDYGRVEALKRELLANPDRRVLAVGHGILLRFFFVHSFLAGDFGPAQVPRMWQLRTVNCGLSAFEHRPHSEEIAYPSPGEWRCVTWMARPWDPD